MLETEIKKLTAAVEALTKAMAPLTADYVPVEAPVEAPVTEEPVEVLIETPVEEPVVQKPMDPDVLTRMCLVLSRAGQKNLIITKLESYGVKRVSELRPISENLNSYMGFCDWVTKQVGEIQ